jgi:hypothetical protein
MKGKSGGGGGGGGGGYNPLQAFIDAANQANSANASRANNLNAGYTAMRDYASQLLGGLGQQQQRDTETAFNNRLSQASQNMINSGLANSSVMADQYRGNARDFSSQMARNAESLLRERLGVELPLIEKQIGFNERINQNAPDPNMLAQLAMQMGQFGQGGGGGGGPRYGAPMFIDSGSIGYQVPASFYGMGGMMPMYRGGSQLVKNARPIFGTGSGGGFGGLMGGNHNIFPKNAGGGFNPEAFLESWTGDGDINSIGRSSPPVGRPPDWSLGADSESSMLNRLYERYLRGN